MDDMQRKKFHFQLIVFCTLVLPGEIAAFLWYDSIPALVFVGIASFLIAKIGADVLEFYQGREDLQPYLELGSGSSYKPTVSRFSADHRHWPDDYRDYYEQEQFSEPERPIQLRRTTRSRSSAEPERPVQPRRTVQLHRLAESEYPVPPRRSARASNDWS